MQYEIICPEDLTNEHLHVWNELRESHPILANPFFDAEFVRASAAVCGNVEVAVIKSEFGVVGFFPFQREGVTLGLPLGTRVSEIQGAIIRPETEWDPLETLRAAELKSWAFDCIPAWQKSVAAHKFCEDQFPFIDVRDGFDAYQANRRQAGSRQLPQAFRKERRLAKEHGPLRFEMHTDDDAAMQALQTWKSAQYDRTGRFDLFRLRWVRELHDRLQGTQKENFSGTLSVLYANEKPVAAHFGIRSRNVLAWCFPGYDPEFHSFSPGLILLAKILQSANDHGIRRLDLGRGPERYKASFATDSWEIAEGFVDSRPVNRTLRRGLYQLRNLTNSSPIASLPLRFYRRLKQSRATYRNR